MEKKGYREKRLTTEEQETGMGENLSFPNRPFGSPELPYAYHDFSGRFTLATLDRPSRTSVSFTGVFQDPVVGPKVGSYLLNSLDRGVEQTGPPRKGGRNSKGTSLSTGRCTSSK